MKNKQKIKAYAILEKNKIIDTGSFWTYSKKEDAESMLWERGRKKLDYEIVPCEILINSRNKTK